MVMPVLTATLLAGLSTATLTSNMSLPKDFVCTDVNLVGNTVYAETNYGDLALEFFNDDHSMQSAYSTDKARLAEIYSANECDTTLCEVGNVSQGQVLHGTLQDSHDFYGLYFVDTNGDHIAATFITDDPTKVPAMSLAIASWRTEE